MSSGAVMVVMVTSHHYWFRGYASYVYDKLLELLLVLLLLATVG